MNQLSKFVLFVVMLAAACLSQARPLYGFTPFPYDATPQALSRAGANRLGMLIDAQWRGDVPDGAQPRMLDVDDGV